MLLCPLTNLILIEKTKLYAIIYVQRPQTYIVQTVCNVINYLNGERGRNMSNTISIDELIEQEYEQQYFEECKFIWQNFVPKSGQARNLQGELLREIENIRCEAQDNGNVNWDDDFTYFCEFIKQSLIEQPIFSEPEKEKICVIMNYLKECGVYAQRFNDGKISDNDVLPEKLAYTKDNLYDIICDFIGRLQNKHPEPIKYSINNSIKR